MKIKLLLLLLASLPVLGSAQVYITIVFHTDLPVRQMENTAVKQACLAEYAAKLKQIEKDRTVTSADLALVEEIQATLVKTLANCDDALRNGKTLYFAFRHLPEIYDKLQQAAGLASNKPFLLPLATNAISIITSRLANLVDYIQNTLTHNDYRVFIDPAKRDRLVTRVYAEINTLNAYATSLCNKFSWYSIQDAANQVVPYRNMVNQDLAVINHITSTFKF